MLFGILGTTLSANAQCLSNPGVTEVSAWNYEFSVTGYLPNMLDYPKVWVRVPGSLLWNSYMMTLWTPISPVYKEFWVVLDFEPTGAGTYDYKFEASCGWLPSTGEWHLSVDEDGHCDWGCN